MTYKRIGIVGAGLIGKRLFDHIQSITGMEVAYVLVTDKAKHAGNPAMTDVVIDNPAEALDHKADLVLECATPDVLKALGPDFLAHSDVCGFSCSVLADRQAETAMRAAAEKSGRRFFVPHGAVLGLDGLRDGRELIEKVVITTTKSGKSLGLSPETSGVLYDGATREACSRFPRNVNVHAAIAFAGIGFDRTRSVVIADPATRDNRHHIVVSGQGIEWEMSLTSPSLGGVTGSFTPVSAVGSFNRIIGADIFANV